MSDINPTLVELRTAFRALDERERGMLGRGITDRAWDDIVLELPALASRCVDATYSHRDPTAWLDRLGAQVLAAKVAYARAENLKIDTGEAA